MQTNFAKAIMSAAIAAVAVCYSIPAAAENWVYLFTVKFINVDMCIDADSIRREPDGGTSYIVLPCEKQARDELSIGHDRVAVRCDRPISTSATYKSETAKGGWGQEQQMGSGTIAAATFACQKR